MPKPGAILPASFQDGVGKQPPPFDPRSHKRRLAKTHGQFGGGATLFGHGRFARRGRCPERDNLARGRLPPDPRFGTVRCPRAMALCLGNWSEPIGGWFALGRRRTARHLCRNGSCVQLQIWDTTSPTRTFRCTLQGNYDGQRTNQRGIHALWETHAVEWMLGNSVPHTANRVTWRPSGSTQCGRLGKSLLRVTPLRQRFFAQSEHGKPCVKTVAMDSSAGGAPCNSCQPLKR